MGIGLARRNWFVARVFVLGAGTLIATTLASCSDAAAYQEKVLYSFCVRGYPCTDGLDPAAGLIGDTLGNLYGTTYMGGNGFEGTVFELTPNAAKTAWTQKVLWSFCAQANMCTLGSAPYSAGLMMDASGNLYGTTYGGGANNGGTVFELTPNAAKTAWTETVLYSFCAQAGCTDGAFPVAGVVRAPSGNLYGTTSDGGLSSATATSGSGVVFELVK
jgi:uncharacterized repeat protein (TIGR03803 family)